MPTKNVSLPFYLYNPNVITMSYPRGYSRENLEQEVDRYGDENPNAHSGSSYFARAALGLTELQRRDSSKLGWWSFGISLFALVVAGAAAYFAYQALREDSEWRTEEIHILTEVKEQLQAPNR